MQDALRVLREIRLRIAGAVQESTVDGPGIRYAIFTQGCLLHCRQCHNPQSWPLDGGMDVQLSVLYQEIKADPLIGGITFTGGEPFLQARALTPLARILRDEGYSLWAFSGYTYEKLAEDRVTWDLLRYLDVLVDGPFVAARASMALTYRGSSNQRLIDVQGSLRAGATVLLSGCD